MGVKTFFKRRELKFLITEEQSKELLEFMGDRIVPDKWGKSAVQSLYYDTGSDGRVLAEYTPEKQYQCAVISHPDIKQGETYNVITSAGTQSVTMSSLIYGSGGMGGSSGMQDGGHGGKPCRW